MGKQKDVIEKLFNHCLKSGDMVFHNTLVKQISVQENFGNPFTATKVDSLKVLPQSLIDADYCIVHLGKGYHKFVKNISSLFHTFEPIEKSVDWQYRKSILNEYNTSESNILSVANNQRILHHFLFGQDTELDDIDPLKRPKTYFPHRTKATFEYYLDPETKLSTDYVQIEIDLTIEFDGVIGVFEAKNGKQKNFSVYQLYHPFLYYHKAIINHTLDYPISNIYCVYMTKEIQKGVTVLKLWAYTFENPDYITSIKLVKSREYRLIRQ